MRTWAALLVAVAAMAACAPPPHSRSAGAVTGLAVRPVPWNPSNAPVGKVQGVADSGDVVCVFADDGATIFSASAVVARDEAAKGFIDGSVILAADGQTRWVVGIDPKGRLWRLRGMSTFEDVGARYGLAGKQFRAATLLDSGAVGFALDREIAVARAQKTSVYPASSFKVLAGGGSFAAGVSSDAIDLVNTTNGEVTRFALPGVTGAALDSKGRLFATTRRAVYGPALDGTLSMILDAGKEDIHGITSSGDRIWFADGSEIGIVDGGRVAETVGLGVSRSAALRGSPSGDVWLLADGKLQRFQAMLGDPPSTSGRVPRSWSSTIAPVFARACVKCHLPDGVSGTDLSTEAAWTAKRVDIRKRVLTDKTMPPQNHPMSEADRAAVRAWIEGK